MLKVYIEWQDVEQAVKNLSEQLRRYDIVPKRILGLGRGGSVPAVMLSHALRVTDVQHLRVSGYDDNNKPLPKDKLRTHLPFIPANMQKTAAMILGGMAADYIDHDDTLIIDDLWDTGNTMKMIQLMFPMAMTAVLFHKSAPTAKQPPPVSLCGARLELGIWYVFPWEEPYDGKMTRLREILSRGHTWSAE